MAELGILELCIVPDLIDQGIFDVTLTRVHRNALEFIDDKEALGLSNDLIHLLRSLCRGLLRGVEELVRKPDLNHVSCLYGDVLVDLLAVDPYVAPFERVEKIA